MSRDDRSVASTSKRFRLAVLNSHPVQYFAPLYRSIAGTDDIDLTVYYCSRQGLQPGHVDPGFGKEVVWDVPLVGGYRHRFLRNIRGDVVVGGFFTMICPGIVPELWRERYDAILLHGHNSATNMLALVAARLVGTRVLMRCETHLLLERGRLKRWARKPVMTALYWLCDACLYIGSLNREFYRAHGVPEDKLFFVPYTVDNDAFIAKASSWKPRREELKRKLGVPSTSRVVLYASKLTTRKRPMDLLLAFESLHSTRVDTALVVVGDGAELPALQDYVAQRGLTDVHFVGFKNQSELPMFYAMADVFVLPSENEPWGLIINEVMCAGIPVVTTTEVGARPDLVIEGETGFSYRRGDLETLVRLLSDVLSSDALRTKLSEGSLGRIRRWSHAQCIDGIRQSLQWITRQVS